MVSEAWPSLMELCVFHLDQVWNDFSSWFGTLWSLSDGGVGASLQQAPIAALIERYQQNITQHRQHSGMQLNGPIQLDHRED